MNALIIERQGANRYQISQSLEELGFAHLRVDWPYRAIDFERVQNFDLCVINIDLRLDLRRFLRLLKEQSSETRIIFMSEKRSRDHYNEVIAELLGSHLVSKTLLEDREWVVPKEMFEHTVRRLFYNHEDVGLSSLFPNTQIQAFQVLGTQNKTDVFDAVEEFANSFQIRSRLVQNIVHLCDELVMNVIFNAPHDKDGRYIYRDHPRTALIKLKAQEQGAIEVAFDGQHFGLSAIDPFGALTIEMVKHYLTRSYREYQIAKGQEGGGMGFLNMFAFASYFEVYVLKNKRTRVTVLLNVRHGFKHARTLPRSFSFLDF